jgi:hypothetical protein
VTVRFGRRRSCTCPSSSAVPQQADHPLRYINRLFSANSGLVRLYSCAFCAKEIASTRLYHIECLPAARKGSLLAAGVQRYPEQPLITSRGRRDGDQSAAGRGSPRPRKTRVESAVRPGHSTLAQRAKLDVGLQWAPNDQARGATATVDRRHVEIAVAREAVPPYRIIMLDEALVPVRQHR